MRRPTTRRSLEGDHGGTVGGGGTVDGGDGGAAMVLVLIVVTVLALGLGTLLSLADTSMRTTVGLRGQAAAEYNADGAMQAAINSIRNSSYNAGAGQHCFGGSDTLTLAGFAGTDSAAVTCKPDPARVLIHCPSLSQCNRPGAAVLTLGRVTGEDGVNIQQPTGSTFRVHGVVFSNSNINVVNGSLTSSARVYARGACTGTIASTPTAACNYGSTANPLGDDPGYLPAAATVPDRRSLPACTTQNSVVTFQPGYYDDARGLSAMMDGNSACRHSTWWFTPGTYYFDFHNSGSNANPLLGGGGNVWTIDDGYLVAGTPVNAAGTVLAAPPVPALIPGSCQNPIKTASAVGVQFIFGGDSQFAIKSGKAEICGTYSISRPPVAIYGLKAGAETPTALTGANALRMSSVVAAGDFTDPGNIVNADAQHAVWTKTNTSTQTGTVTVRGYAPPAAIPAGSVLQSATLRVVHGNTAGSDKDALSVQVSPAGGTPFTVTVPAYNDNAMHTDMIDVSQARTGTLAQLVYAGALGATDLRYAATVKHIGAERVDAIQLELSYTPPAYRAQSGCVVAGPYTGLGSAAVCAAVTTVNNVGNLFYLQGTTYLPLGVVDVTLNNVAEQVFRFGIVARSLWVKLTGSFAYAGPVIEVPDDSPGFGFSVYLSVYLCPSSGTCSPAGTPQLRAKVAYVDSDPVTPAPGQRQVVVLSWSRPH